MRPTSLAVRGLKSWADFNLDLGPLTAFQGPNGAGKTALIQAFKLALLGYDPDVGKQLKETRTIIDPAIGVIEVALSFDNGFGIRRYFSGKTKSHVMPSQGEGTNNECQARIDAETGGLVIALDLAEFLSMSDEKRREWLFTHLPKDPDALDWKTFQMWTASKEGLEDVVLNLWEKSVQVAPNPVIGLGNAIEVAHREALDSERRRQDQFTIAANIENRFRASKKPPVVPADSLSEIVQTIATLNQRIGQARAGLEAAENIRSRAARFRDSLADHETKHADTSVALKKLKTILDGATEPPDVTALETRVANSEEPISTHSKELEAAQRAEVERRAELANLEGQRAALEDRGPCPYADLGCTTDPDALTSGPLEEILAQIPDAKEAVASAAQEVILLAGDLKKMRKAVDELEKQIRLGKDAAADLKRMRQGVEDKRTRLEELTEQIAIDRTELTTAEKEEKGLGDDDGSASLYHERDASVEEEATLRTAIEASAAYERTRASVREERDRLEAMEKKEKALKNLDENLRRLRAHVTERMMEPLHKEADRILHSIDPQKRWRFIFERENRAIMDFGFEEDGTLRLFNAASKGEQAMLAVALLGSILIVLDPKMKLLIVDNVEKLWPENRTRLMKALASLSGELDAVVIAGACDFKKVQGWEIVDLTPTAEVAA